MEEISWNKKKLTCDLSVVFHFIVTTFADAMEYKVQLTETLQRLVFVSATSKEEAVETVCRMYRSEEIILGAEDFIDTEIKVDDSHQ